MSSLMWYNVNTRAGARTPPSGGILISRGGTNHIMCVCVCVCGGGGGVVWEAGNLWSRAFADAR